VHQTHQHILSLSVRVVHTADTNTSELLSTTGRVRNQWLDEVMNKQILEQSKLQKGRTINSEFFENFNKSNQTSKPPDVIFRQVRRNLSRMRQVFDSLSNNSGFLPLDLADEAIESLVGSGVHSVTVVACLRHLCIGGHRVVDLTRLPPRMCACHTTSQRPRPGVFDYGVANACDKCGCLEQLTTWHLFETLGMSRDAHVFDIDSPTAKEQDLLDWTQFRETSDNDKERAAALAKFSNGNFIQKSAILDYVKHLQWLHAMRDLAKAKVAQPRVLPPGVNLTHMASKVHQSQKMLSHSYSLPPKSSFTRPHALSPDLHSSSIPKTPQKLSPPEERVDDVVVDENVVQSRMKPNLIRMNINFEVLHKVLHKVGLSNGLLHSRVLWILIEYQLFGDGPLNQLLPATEACQVVVNLFLQPKDSSGDEYRLLGSGYDDICQYGGYFTFPLFKRFLKLIGFRTGEKGMRNMWEDLQKDPWDLSEFVPRRTASNVSRSTSLAAVSNQSDSSYFICLEMDKLGLDPTRGKTVKIDNVRRQLPRMITTGLTVDSLRILLQLLLELSVNEEKLTTVVESLSKNVNRYGLVKYEDVGQILSDLSVEGMSFPMLRDLISKMRLDFPGEIVKRMFDVMDLNNDKTLSLIELLGGFEVLIGRFLPDYICEAVGVTVGRAVLFSTLALLGLITFFSFLGLAIASFTSVRSSVGSAVQSALALIGAVGLQNQASQDLEQVRKNMYERIEGLFGEALKEKLKEGPSPASGGAGDDDRKEKSSRKAGGVPVKLRYNVPKKFHPELKDPRPCVTFFSGAYVRLDPVISGRVDKDLLRWTISPKLKPKLGLVFSERTGVIEGTIQTQEKGLRDLQVPRKTYVVIVQNSAGAAKARITFQILPRSRHSPPRVLPSQTYDNIQGEESTFG